MLMKCAPSFSIAANQLKLGRWKAQLYQGQESWSSLCYTKRSQIILGPNPVVKMHILRTLINSIFWLTSLCPLLSNAFTNASFSCTAGEINYHYNFGAVFFVILCNIIHWYHTHNCTLRFSHLLVVGLQQNFGPNRCHPEQSKQLPIVLLIITFSQKLRL